MPALLLAALCAAAWAAPSFEPAPGLAGLKTSADACLQGVSELLSLPVEEGRVKPLKDAIDKIAAQASAAASSAGSLRELTGPPWEAMNAAAKGKGPGESLDRRIAARKDALFSLKLRWEKADAAAKKLKDSPPEPAEPERDLEAAKKKKERREELLKKLLAAVDEAQQKLWEAEGALRPLEDAASAAKREASRAGPLRDELSSAADSLSSKSLDLSAAADEAKTAVDGLSVEPKQDSRGRAYRKIEVVTDGGRAVFYQADVARNRALSFEERWRAFGKALKSFDEADKSLEEKLKAPRSLLDAAEKLLEDLADRK